MIANVEALTIFNGRLDKATRRKVYVPTVIRGAFYTEGKGSKVTNSGVWSEDVQYKIRIPAAAEVQDGRAYARDQEYAALPDGETAGRWTIQKGDLVALLAYAPDAPAPPYEPPKVEGGTVSPLEETEPEMGAGESEEKPQEAPALYEDAVTAWARGRGLDLIHVTEYADNTAGGSQYLKHWRIGGK